MKHLVAIAVVVVVSISTAAAVAAERAYTDDVGDAGTAPDLTSVTVSDSNGFLAFKIAGNLAPSTSYVIYVDTDRNQSTGDEGDELMLGVDQESDGKTFWFASRWVGSKWERAGIDVSSQGFPGRQELGFRAADAGITGTFDFVVVSYKMVADAVESRDRAPDSIVPWSYELTSRTTGAAAKAALGQARLKPAHPLAGKPLTVRVPVSQSDTKQPLTTGVATCSARVKARVVRGNAAVANGWATCRFVVPKGSRGTTGRASITVGAGTQAVTKAFSFRIS